MNNNEPVLFSTWGRKYQETKHENEGMNDLEYVSDFTNVSPYRTIK